MHALIRGAQWRHAVRWVKAHHPNVCHLCGQPINLDLPPRHPQSYSVDHITPVARGGHPLDSHNLAPAHYGCNSAKGDRLHPHGERIDDTSTDW